VFTMAGHVVDLLKALALSIFSIIYSFILLFIPKRLLFKDVKGQIVLITGGGSGFGRILAYKFAVDHGSIAVIWDINQQGLDQTKKEVEAAGGKCHSYVVDVSSREAIYKAAKQLKSEVGAVNILINNAGIGDGSFLEETKDEYIEKMLKINTLAHFWTVKAFLPDMVRTGPGHIVTMASCAGLFGAPRLTHYCASKFGAVGFHEAVMAEIGALYPQANINSTLICPFFTRTPMIAGKEDDIKTSLLFPIREAEPVVQEMMEAILTNEELLITSNGMIVLRFLKVMVPARVMKTLRSSFTTMKTAASTKNK